jgi:hypothetical protein
VLRNEPIRSSRRYQKGGVEQSAVGHSVHHLVAAHPTQHHVMPPRPASAHGTEARNFRRNVGRFGVAWDVCRAELSRIAA